MAVQPKKNAENDEWQVSSISDVEVDLFNSGVDTATKRFFGIGADVTAWELRTDQIVTIEEINGFTLKSPLTINANTSWTNQKTARFRLRSLKINVLTANTNLKLFVQAIGKGEL
ncbi:hypothetical protein M0R04_11175 [Candidatus Dojkabacteria bacterium]|jgi:hypothetical protein|nr:hypothetical protein [Candidatus Dojkabacteria bacterium]